jgi:hypothetical protein
VQLIFRGIGQATLRLQNQTNMGRILSLGRRLLTFVLYLAIVNMTGGCSYYKVRSNPNPDKALIAQKTQMPEKYIIIHLGDKVWHLANIGLNEAKTDMTGYLDDLPLEHMSYIGGKKARNEMQTSGPIRYHPTKSKPTHEIHIYLADSTAFRETGQTSIPLDGVRRIDIYDPAIGATIASYVFTTLGIIAGVVLIIGIIALATKSSCPFLYVSNGAGWQFTGEMYGGAIAAPLERDDYMPLPGVNSIDGTYELKIANELKERQYTNIAELMVIDHNVESAVLADKNGNLHSISRPVLPQSASANGHNCINALSAKDTTAYLFDEPDADDDAFSSVVMSFPKPVDTKTGKLVIKAKNSYWLDYMFARFTEQFGTWYNEFAAQQKTAPAAESRQWSLKQGIPLSVQIYTGARWEDAGYFDVLGPLAAREMVMPIDLSRVKDKDVRIRLRCGARFWEVDYAAMDFTADVPLAVQRLIPSTAIDEKRQDQSAALAGTDSKYLAQPDVGNVTIVRYTAPIQVPGTSRTIIFHSRGYYEYIRSYTKKPNLSRLLTFKKAGSFTRFAASEYRRLAGQKDLLATALNN